MPSTEILDDLVETIMGEALLSLDKNGRRGTSEPIQWEIIVESVPYCYRCVQPMQQISSGTEGLARPDSSDWKCEQCGTVMQVS
jgi:hypothetical protein